MNKQELLAQAGDIISLLAPSGITSASPNSQGIAHILGMLCHIITERSLLQPEIEQLKKTIELCNTELNKKNFLIAKLESDAFTKDARIAELEAHTSFPP